MKKIMLLFLFAFAGSFAQEVKFTAKIQNRNSDSIAFRGRNFMKSIKINDKGVFTGSFEASPGIYQMSDGSEMTLLYLKPGFDLNLTMDAKMFDETIVYKGKGEKENNFLAQKALIDEKFEESMESFSDQAAFDKGFAERNKKLETMLADKSIDPDFKALAEKMMAGEDKQMAMMFTQAMKTKQLAGKPSPLFDYENYKGGKTKLTDLKGKYVYLDIWATWCGPCRAEIPHLQRVEDKYHGKNIEFVSISIDDIKDHEKWQKFVKDKNLGGVQLFADKNWASDFITAYGINSIPRFILIDPNGNVVDANAARPSDPSLVAQLDKLLK